MPHAFVPEHFQVPSGFDSPGFQLGPLGPQHNERDHEAWMSSIEHIYATPGFQPPATWPRPMSLEANLADLEQHARDFEARDGFTYSILDGNDVIGCVYIYPATTPDHDASVRSWIMGSSDSVEHGHGRVPVAVDLDCRSVAVRDSKLRGAPGVRVNARPDTASTVRLKPPANSRRTKSE